MRPLVGPRVTARIDEDDNDDYNPFLMPRSRQLPDAYI